MDHYIGPSYGKTPAQINNCFDEHKRKNDFTACETCKHKGECQDICSLCRKRFKLTSFNRSICSDCANGLDEM